MSHDFCLGRTHTGLAQGSSCVAPAWHTAMGSTPFWVTSHHTHHWAHPRKRQMAYRSPATISATSLGCAHALPAAKNLGLGPNADNRLCMRQGYCSNEAVHLTLPITALVYPNADGRVSCPIARGGFHRRLRMLWSYAWAHPNMCSWPVTTPRRCGNAVSGALGVGYFIDRG